MKILMKILWFLPHFVVPVLQQFFFFAAIAIAFAPLLSVISCIVSAVDVRAISIMKPSGGLGYLRK